MLSTTWFHATGTIAWNLYWNSTQLTPAAVRPKENGVRSGHHSGVSRSTSAMLGINGASVAARKA